ncbi:hypothetical protein A6V39_01645 [Candidatus Mycoplasma haematobovis]|uniref:Uncharacterized protein n=1 Tax=Candidatus Mycoplasma haematobovis TaxID=432608 RepID=A0A1A9QFM3_9MOLU|nr:hypothetical protein A6V39_01645 [Candidatus Mycoplasma haematobovis]
MNLHRIGFAVFAETLVAGEIVATVILLNSSKPDVNYVGKTLKSKYPLLKALRSRGYFVIHNNSFWLEETKKLHQRSWLKFHC